MCFFIDAPVFLNRLNKGKCKGIKFEVSIKKEIDDKRKEIEELKCLDIASFISKSSYGKHFNKFEI
jgi:hypothetical protein